MGATPQVRAGQTSRSRHGSRLRGPSPFKSEFVGPGLRSLLARNADVLIVTLVSIFYHIFGILPATAEASSARTEAWRTLLEMPTQVLLWT